MLVCTVSRISIALVPDRQSVAKLVRHLTGGTAMDLRRSLLVVVGLGLLANALDQASDVFGIERRYETRRQAAMAV